MRQHPNETSLVNPITVEVVRASLAHIANEMATVLRKTSYNMMIYEVRDYCVGIVDPEGNILSQNFGALPIFLADLGPAIIDGVRMHGKNGFHPGDVLIMNHPYVCGQHLNNVVVYTPFFSPRRAGGVFGRARALDRHRRHPGWFRL